MKWDNPKKRSNNRDWLDWWLSDDLPPPEVESNYIPPPDDSPMFKEKLPPEEPGATNITVNLHVPKINIPSLKKLNLRRLKSLPHQSIAKTTVFAVGMILVGFATHSFIFPPDLTNGVAQPQQVLGVSPGNTSAPATSLLSTAVDSQQSSTVLSANTNSASTKASFTPVSPANKPELGTYAFAKTSYDSATGTYRYLDTIDGGPFTVSQQELPSQYSSGKDAVDKIATQINAEEPIFTNSGTAYMYTDQKTGHQTIVFSVKGLLVSINSNFGHLASVWQSYINQLT